MNSPVHIIILSVLLFSVSNITAQKDFNDTIIDPKGDIIIHVLGHSSVFIEYDTLKVYIDPYSKVHDFSEMPKASIIFITHEHSDHFDPTAIEKITQSSTWMVYTQTCESLNKYTGNDTIMANGDSINIFGLPVKATPAYNPEKTQHPKGVGNGYVIQFGNTRIYFAGDTEKIPEMADLMDIDVAFLPMSQPFNMTPEMLVESAILIQPGILIPYHYDDNSPSTLLELMKDYPEITVLTGEEDIPISDINNTDLSDILIYPNPVSNYFYIKNQRKELEISVYNVNSKLLYKKSVQENNPVNISNLPAGIYLIKGNFDKGKKYLKLIKQ